MQANKRKIPKVAVHEYKTLLEEITLLRDELKNERREAETKVGEYLNRLCGLAREKEEFSRDVNGHRRIQVFTKLFTIINLSNEICTLGKLFLTEMRRSSFRGEGEPVDTVRVHVKDPSRERHEADRLSAADVRTAKAGDVI